MTTVELREATEEDAPAIAGLLNAISSAYYGEADSDADEVRSWLREPEVTMVLAERDGELRGYGDVGWDKRRPHLYWLDVRVPPGANVTDELLADLERRAVPKVETPLRLCAYAGAAEQELVQALTTRGYGIIRYAFRMRRDLDGPVEAPPLPQGLELRPFRPEDEERVHEAHMDSFADHWEFARSAREDWRRWNLERPGTDTTLWHLAYDGDELAAICLCRPFSKEQPTFGWVDILGVRPPWRRRGVGHALLLHAFRMFQRRGYDAVGLGVDGENPTGAVRLYERAGMKVSRRFDLYERTLG